MIEILGAIKRGAVELPPYDAVLEWLGTDGNSFVDLGFIAKKSKRFIVEMWALNPVGGTIRQWNSSSSDWNSFSVNGETGTFYAMNYNAKIVFNTSDLTAPVFHNWTFDYVHKRVLCDGIQIGETSSGDPVYDSSYVSYPLFVIKDAWKDIIYSRGQGTEIGHVKIYTPTATMFDLKPVRVGSVGYFYDKVSGSLFGNNGEGNLVKGPDIL